MHRLREAGVQVTSIGKLHFRSGEDDNGFTEEILPMHVVGGVGWPVGLLREELPAYDSAAELAADVGYGESSYTNYDLAITEAAEQWLRAKEGADQPWAAFVSLVSPHYPLTAPKEYYDLYDQANVPLPIAYDPGQRPDHSELANVAGFFNYDQYFDEAKMREAIVSYLALTTFLDDCVGRVLTALEDSGQAEETVMLYVSDHGEMLGDHGFWTKQVMYEASAGVPMILAGPGVQSGRTVRTATSLVDMAATALDVTGVGEASELPGESLVGLANADDNRDRAAFSEYHDGGSTTGTFMVRWADWKYVHYVGHPSQLFNLAEDPEERRNLAVEGVNDTDVRAAWAEGEQRLRAICNPEDINVLCFEDQKRKIAELGGEEACLNAFVFNHTPTPV